MIRNPGHPRWYPRNERFVSGGYFPIILSTTPSIATIKPKTEQQDQEKGMGMCKEGGVFSRYYASAES
jgi:hypothetical protein